MSLPIKIPGIPPLDLQALLTALIGVGTVVSTIIAILVGTGNMSPEGLPTINIPNSSSTQSDLSSPSSSSQQETPSTSSQAENNSSTTDNEDSDSGWHPKKVNVAPDSPEVAEWKRQIGQDLIDYRKSLGINPYPGGVDKDIADGAQKWAEIIASDQKPRHDFSHSVGTFHSEVIHGSYDGNPLGAIKSLSHSSRHARILRASFYYYGIGIAKDAKGTVYVVIRFI